MTWEQFFNWLMIWEGKTVSNDPRDPGGQTAWGISRRYFPKWAGWGLDDAGRFVDPRFEGLVSEFYLAQYSDIWKCIPSRANAVAVDTAINMGRAYSIQCVQGAMNNLAGSRYVLVDGVLGQQTLAALKTVDAGALAYAMCALRLAEYGRRGRQGDSRRVFLDGWINRVRSLMEVV